MFFFIYIIIYLTTLFSRTDFIVSIRKAILSEKVRKTWTKFAVSYFKHFYCIYVQGVVEIAKYIGLNRRFPDKENDAGPPSADSSG
jgi:hypothetical protein